MTRGPTSRCRARAAATQDEAETIIRQQNLFITKLTPKKQTTAAAVESFLRASAFRSLRLTVSARNDDDFVFFHIPARGVQPATEAEITDLVRELQESVAGRIAEAHGEEIATLFDIYVGRAHVYYNPKMRLERLIYRGIREAANAAKSVEERERARKVTDLKVSLRERAVYVDYHPIVVAETRAVFGYEALARGVRRSLRSPEVMFEVAAEADLLWELSRLCRSRALEGMREKFVAGEVSEAQDAPIDFTVGECWSPTDPSRALPHESAAAHVTGLAPYADDLAQRRPMLDVWPVQRSSRSSRSTSG